MRIYASHRSKHLQQKTKCVSAVYNNTFKYIPIYIYIRVYNTFESFFLICARLRSLHHSCGAGKYWIGTYCQTSARSYYYVCCVCALQPRVRARQPLLLSFLVLSLSLRSYTIIHIHIYIQYITHCCLCNSSVSYYTYIYVYM